MSSDPRNSTAGGDRPRDRRGELGRLGEDLACQRLTDDGLRVVARNWRCRHGEIDLVAEGPGLLVFCEVKTRRGHGFGTPGEAVTHAKRSRLRRLAAAYLDAVDHPSVSVRFDVVSVTLPRGRAAVVEHLEAAF